MLFYLGTIIALNVDLNVDILSACIIDSDIWTARGKGQGPSRYPVCQSVIHRKDTPNTHIMILCEITAHLLSCTQTHNQWEGLVWWEEKVMTWRNLFVPSSGNGCIPSPNLKKGGKRK